MPYYIIHTIGVISAVMSALYLLDLWRLLDRPEVKCGISTIILEPLFFLPFVVLILYVSWGIFS